MKNLIIISLLFLFIPFKGHSKNWTLVDANLEVQFDDQTALLSVKDKRCNKTWEQSALAEEYKVKKTSQKGNALNVVFTGRYSFEVNFTLTDASVLDVSLTANNKLPMTEIAYPAAFTAPNKNHYLLMTDSEGLLLPVDDTGYPMTDERIYFCGGGVVMAWMGMTDTQFQTGYMAILETPFDASFRTKRKNGFVVFEPVWLSSMEKFGYTRKVSYHFFDKGGYVAQCKTYKEYVWKKNNVITLKENEKRFPAIAKMIGAPHMYVWDNARTATFAQEMKSSGVDKAFILWDANHTPYPEIGFDDTLKGLGYASGAYDIFTDIHYRDTVMWNKDETGPRRFSPVDYPGMFHKLAARKKDGETYFNQFGHTICPAVIRPQILKRIHRRLKEFPTEAYLLDVYQANGLFECYSPEHPLTRQQYAEEIIKNLTLVKDSFDQFLGGEWGADFVGSKSIFAHGMMTLHRTWWGTGIDEKGSIYYTGDWESDPSPTQMIGTRVANDKYLKYSINEYTRVPLYELVYHGAVVTSLRWEVA